MMFALCCWYQCSCTQLFDHVLVPSALPFKFQMTVYSDSQLLASKDTKTLLYNYLGGNIQKCIASRICTLYTLH